MQLKREVRKRRVNQNYPEYNTDRQEDGQYEMRLKTDYRIKGDTICNQISRREKEWEERF